MAENTLGLFFEISADPSRATQALANFRGASERETQAVAGHLTALQAGAERARSAHEAAFSSMTRTVEGFGNSTLGVYSRIAEGLLRNMDLEQLAVTHKSKTEAAKLLVSKQAVKEHAVVKAAQAFAKGLEALGDLNFWSAGQYFASAALYGSLAAIQISGLIGGGGSTGRASASGLGGGGAAAGGTRGYGGPVALAPGAASALGQPSGKVTVLVVGEPQAAAWLTKTINQGVLQQDLMLVSSHTKRSAPAGR